jgi:hypothetical protein
MGAKYMATKTYHVISNPEGGWIVKRTGAARASKSFHTKADAVVFARGVAKDSCSELFIHGIDGKIKECDSYGCDPCPPRGSKR